MSKTNRPGNKNSLVFSLDPSSPDIETQTFRAGGKGGQKQNKTESGVRYVHKPSGARGESREERSQLQNKRAAWKRLVTSPIFRGWLALKLSDGPTPEERVEADMRSENLKVEIQENGKWVDEKM